MKWAADTTPMLTSADVAAHLRHLGLVHHPDMPIVAEYGPVATTEAMPINGTAQHISAWNRAASLAKTGPNRRQHQGEARVLLHQILGRAR